MTAIPLSFLLGHEDPDVLRSHLAAYLRLNEETTALTIDECLAKRREVTRREDENIRRYESAKETS